MAKKSIIYVKESRCGRQFTGGMCLLDAYWLTWRWPEPARTVWKQVASPLGGEDRLTSLSETMSFWLMSLVRLSAGSSGLIRKSAASGSCPCMWHHPTCSTNVLPLDHAPLCNIILSCKQDVMAKLGMRSAAVERLASVTCFFFYKSRPTLRHLGTSEKSQYAVKDI